MWAELKVHLNVGGAHVIDDSNLLGWFLDPDIQFPNPSAVTNMEPLLVNTAGSLKYRPGVSTELPNLFLASDYVRTNSDLACMESANEAARRAVNAILQSSGSKCQAGGGLAVLGASGFRAADRVRPVCDSSWGWVTR